ncbi:MAG: T9SS type A sorting domain-containing protein [Bacteroidota bacterium]|nr:T9SS type A sorting domain-containing protein [Bacteroidota bacterium]
MKHSILLSLTISAFFSKAQFAPPAGQFGTTAIYKDSSIIINWATNCKVTRGWQDISNTSIGKTTVGDSASAIGYADGTNVVSLGDGGNAIVTFPSPIKNGVGFDFCVFENPFNDNFLELAFVEVSSDGVNFTRFPATSNTQTLTQIGPFDLTSDATQLNNLAGKYKANYGTPFDLQELQGTPGLDVNNITHVKIIDVVGNITNQFATYDKNNNVINDPWPTAFASGGFDLDAVGVIHQQPVGINELNPFKIAFTIYPNPFQNSISIISNTEIISEYKLIDELGTLLQQQKINANNFSLITENLPSGFYFIEAKSLSGNTFTQKVIKL